ncbi:restriction endonuclease subunit S [Brumicola nitratireducens]|uniref:Type I restriction-modification system specificity determinant n=1 Tax=Glaciecola nitratireducens (strain JCM 12485 / KCTC 12276 / FR1064) TaxID=1085623 RepID=G4QH82_GLANF|nr:restriction endonuclease subunit S [Glaciecola nitratireducens]AEP29713.1 type I restriction-modification system specificity determinant [Glaciecola nitratireducens FR1064]
MPFENRYSAYKYSEYFNTDLPEYWEEKRLGYLADQGRTAFVDGPFGSDLKTNDYKDSGVPLIQLNNIRGSKHLMQNMKFVTEEKKQQLIRHLAIPGEIVIAKMAEPVARCAIVNDEYPEYLIVADCVKLTPNIGLVDLSYLVWAINSECVKVNAELVSTGTTRIRINLGELKKLKIPYPSFAEQKTIANFLDHETAKIDTLIAKQQQLIALLKEKRQAVISHAVTKGLNPNAAMRESGVEWLGEVPKHWELPKLIHHTSRIGDGLHSTPKYQDNTGYYFVNGNNLVNGHIWVGATAKEVPEEEYKNHYVHLDATSVLLSINGTIGNVARYNDEKIILGKSAAYMNCSGDLLPEYLMLYLQSSQALRYFDLEVTGTTIFNLSLNSIRQMKVCIPPEAEQLEIDEYCHLQRNKYGTLIEKASTAITLMKERRTALISAAVTGKIDVRNWQPPHNTSDARK